MMMEPLTREQVDARFLMLKAITILEDYDCVVQLEGSYAALRVELTAMTEQWRKTNGEYERVSKALCRMQQQYTKDQQEITRLRKLLLSFNPLNYYEAVNSLTCQVCHAEGLDNGKPFIHTATCDWYILRQALEGTKEGAS